MDPSLGPIGNHHSIYVCRLSISANTRWVKLVKLRKNSNLENLDIQVRLTVEEIQGSIQLLQDSYPLLPYASKHWLSHTSTFTVGNSRTWRLWTEILEPRNADSFIQRPWISKERDQTQILGVLWGKQLYMQQFVAVIWLPWNCCCGEGRRTTREQCREDSTPSGTGSTRS